MLKKLAFGSLGLVLLVPPVFASADTLSDLQAQIQALLAQIAVLKSQLGVSSETSPEASVCVALSSSLSLDDTDADNNGDVTKLQQFLASQGSSIYPEARVTGYFGPATMRAVQRWQAAHGLVSSGDPDSTGYGYVGPKTRAAMAQNCAPGAVVPIAAPYQPLAGLPSIHIISPNGGTYVAGSGTSLTIQWSITNVPAGGKVCAALIRMSDNRRFAFPPENVCAQAFNGPGSMAGNLTRTLGYDLGPGTYNLELNMYGIPRTDGKDTPAVATETSINPIQLVEKTTTAVTPGINTFAVSPSQTTAGQAASLSWISSLAQNCHILRNETNGGYFAIATNAGTSGTYAVYPTTSSAYTLECYGTSDGSGKDAPAVHKTIFVSVIPAPLPDITFAPGSHTTFTLTVGQSATDGVNGVRIKLESVATNSSGYAVANVTVTSSGYQPGFYSARSGMPLSIGGGFADSLSPTGGIIVDVTLVSLQGHAIFTVDPGLEKG